MSAAEIADNKWEVESTKPQIANPAGIAQLLLFGGFAAFFGYILIFSLIGMFSAKEESDLAGKFSHMDDAKAAPAEAPAE